MEDWQQEMYRLVESFERDSITALRKISRNFVALGRPFDEQFHQYFMRMSSLRLDSSFDIVLFEHKIRTQAKPSLNAPIHGNGVENYLDIQSSTKNHDSTASRNGNSVQLEMFNEHEVDAVIETTDSDVEDVVQEHHILAVEETIFNNLVEINAPADIGLDLNDGRENVNIIVKEECEADNELDVNMVQSDPNIVKSIASEQGGIEDDETKTSSLSSSAQNESLKRNNRKRIKCTDCKYVASCRASLITHQRIHTGIKPFKCHHCSYASTRKGNLKTHLSKHSNDRPFKCSLCDYACRRKNDLSSHLYTHTSVKPFKCGQCSYATAYRANLSKHLKSHLKLRPFKCPHCKWAYKYENGLQRHLKFHDSQ